MSVRLPYRLGLPAWAFPGWRDRYFSPKPSMLASYARVFNTVEGNTTFYRVPDSKSVANWRSALEGTDLQMCFKLPRTVTHERRPNLADLDAFLRAIAPLGEHVGPLFLQFPATVGPGQMPAMESVFAQLPGDYRYVVEVRHPDYFSQPDRLSPVLDRLEAGRVILDSRPLYTGDRSHPDVANALHEKPDVPILPDVINDIAFVRLILHPDPRFNGRFVDEWTQRTARYIEQGCATYMMIHCPNNLHCPEFARAFHDQLRGERKRASIAALNPWPVPQQASLI